MAPADLHALCPLFFCPLQSLLLDEHLAELAGLHRLEQLSLRGCSRLTGLGLAQLGRLRCSLTMLNLSNCTALTGGVGRLAMSRRHAPRARMLPHNGLLSQYCVRCPPPDHALSRALTSARLADYCVAALAAALPQLATLNLQGCSRLGDDAIGHLATMPHLRWAAAVLQ